MEQAKIKVLIVDDEPLARRGIRQLLSDETDFAVVGEAGNGRTAHAAIQKLAPDVVFLDIQMPVVDGFSLAETINGERAPEIVFVTAYDEHALRAFDAGAVDYLLKPIDPARFRKTLHRLRGLFLEDRANELDLRFSALLRDLEAGRAGGGETKYLERIAIKQAGRIQFVAVDEIDWISSEGNYAQLHANGRTYLVRVTMDGLERKLDPNRFIRLRRSTIVRVAQIKELQPLGNGECVVVLLDQTRLSASRRYRQNLNLLLKGSG